jgi:hypothetical protein
MEPLPYRGQQPGSSRRRAPFWLLVLIGGLLHFVVLIAVAAVDMDYDGANVEMGRSHFARVMERVADRAVEVLTFPALPAPGVESPCAAVLLRILVNAVTWGTAFAVPVWLAARRRRAAAPGTALRRAREIRDEPC